MNKKFLKIIRQVGFDFSWDNKKVWKLKIPTTKINISELEWHFKIPFWNYGNKKYNLKPISVIKFPKRYNKEYRRTMDSDVSHPVEIMKNKGRWLILDGLHRLVKLKILGNSKIQVRKIPRSRVKDILK